MKKLDLTKPVQTRDGYAARIISTNLQGPYSVGAVILDVDGRENLESYLPDGTYNEGKSGCMDLVNVPEKKVWERWVTVYSGGTSATLASYNEAQGYLRSGGTIIHVKHEYIEGEHQP